MIQNNYRFFSQKQSIKVSFQAKTYHSSIFRNFKAIDAGEFRQVVRYYERNEKAILQLEFEEYFEMLIVYTNALFEISEYQKHILMSNVVIETSIMENIQIVNGQEVFKSMLFRKAASHYNLFEYKKAIHVLRELLKIEPNNTENALFLEQCLRNDQPHLARYARAAAIFLFLLSALTVSVEVLFVRHFYQESAPMIELSRNLMFFLGFTILVIGTVWHRWQSHSEVQKFIQEIRKTKKHNHISR